MPDCPANRTGLPVPQAEVPQRVRVMLPVPLTDALDYRVAAAAAVPAARTFVRVELGSRRLVGVVWDPLDEAEAAVPLGRLKPIIETLPAPPRTSDLRRFVERVADYTLAPVGAVLRMTMSVEEALFPSPPRRVCSITETGLTALGVNFRGKLTAARRRVLDALQEGAASIAETTRRAGCGA